MMLDISDLDKSRFKGASKNLFFNRFSCRWVATVVQDFEIVVIRQNFQHGFISLGWDGSDKKFIVYSKDKDQDQRLKYRQFIWKKMLSLSKVIADHLNLLEKE